jgi:uncharacterized protein YwgA
MARRDWLLLLLGFKGANGSALDPVRIQKGMFLFAQEADAPAEERYDFQPYNYGPYSFDLRNDLRQLVVEGLATEEPVPGYTWSRYRLTTEGMHKAKNMRDTADHDVAQKLFDIKQSVTGKSFNTLLRDVYDDYPEFATNSIFRR